MDNTTAKVTQIDFIRIKAEINRNFYVEVNLKDGLIDSIAIMNGLECFPLSSLLALEGLQFAIGEVLKETKKHYCR